MANFWGGCTPPRHSGTWVGARVASLRCHYPPPRRSQYSRNAEDRPHQSKTSCRGGHRRGTTTSGPGRGPLAGFAVTFYGRFSGDRRGLEHLRTPFVGTAAITSTTLRQGTASSKASKESCKTPAMEQGDKLSGRLNEHRKNIAKAATTLRLEDFEYRALVVQTG